jgi:hypothetical protein
MSVMFEPLEDRVLLSHHHPVSNVLSVSSNGRFLVQADGAPFFYMADTAWNLFDRTSLKQAREYLETRAAEGFTVIQAEINARLGPDVNGDAPFIKNDPNRPNEAYFEFVDAVVAEANSLGMYVALVPLDSKWSVNGIFNNSNVYQFGRYVGRRYANDKIIWIMGGDVAGTDGDGIDMWRNMAAGVTRGVSNARGAGNRDYSQTLMTFHPFFAESSAQWFQNDEWLDFNAIQSGHSVNPSNYTMIASNYSKTPAKPTIDIESDYEDIPAGIKRGATRLTAYDVRKSAYWSLFAGSFGVTYGNNNVWQFVSTPNGSNLATTSWENALVTAGTTSMAVLKRLMNSRPFLDRVPDQSVIVGSTLSGTDHLQATRASDGSYAFVYDASGKSVTVNLNKLSGTQIEARWFNPRSAKSAYLGVFAKNGNHTFAAPTQGDDWVLVLDDASKKYGKP